MERSGCGCGADAELLGTVRELLHLSYTDLAAELGMSRRHVIRLCRQRHSCHRRGTMTRVQQWLHRLWANEERRRRLLQHGLVVWPN